MGLRAAQVERTRPHPVGLRPAWYLTALLFEPVRDTLLHVTSEALRQTPEYRDAEARGTLPPTALPEEKPLEAGLAAARFESAQAEPAPIP